MVRNRTANGSWYLITPPWGASATDQGSVGDHFAVLWRSFLDDLLLIAESTEYIWIPGVNVNAERTTGDEFHINYFIYPQLRIFQSVNQTIIAYDNVLSVRRHYRNNADVLSIATEEETSLKFKSKCRMFINKKGSRKFCLRYGGHFVSATVCKYVSM